MKVISGENYFNEKSFNEICKELEKGEVVSHNFAHCILGLLGTFGTVFGLCGQE